MRVDMPLRLRKRAEFVAVQKAQKYRGPLFLLELRQRNPEEKPGPDGPPRIGFTVSRKNGNAVKRNRIKRRLREAVRIGVSEDLQNGYDYVIVARPQILNVDFQTLIRELRKRIVNQANR